MSRRRVDGVIPRERAVKFWFPHRPVLDPVLGVRPQIVFLCPIKGVVGRAVARGIRRSRSHADDEGTVGTPSAQAWADVV